MRKLCIAGSWNVYFHIANWVLVPDGEETRKYITVAQMQAKFGHLIKNFSIAYFSYGICPVIVHHSIPYSFKFPWSKVFVIFVIILESRNYLTSYLTYVIVSHQEFKWLGLITTIGLISSGYLVIKIIHYCCKTKTIALQLKFFYVCASLRTITTELLYQSSYSW